jgi:uncharacterized protein (DUF2147 family)
MTGYRASAAIVLLSAGPVMAEPSMLGLWARGDGKAVVRIEHCGANLCAINTWIRAGTKNEKAGDKLILTVAPSGPSLMTGQAFDPQRNLTYRMRIEVGERTMSSRGCILAGLLCRSMSWRRLSSASQ